jgi:hypothetical protein
LQLSQKFIDALFGLLDGDSINTGCTTVGSYQPPSML